MITCSSIKFSRHQMGYDLRRNETLSYDYEDMFSTNMYAKVSCFGVEKNTAQLGMILMINSNHIVNKTFSYTVCVYQQLLTPLLYLFALY